MNEQSVYALFSEICEARPNDVAFRYKSGDAWQPITWAAHRDTCARISKGLIALGIHHGDGVNILSMTRPEWVQCDIGIVSIGAITIGIYHSNLPEDCEYIVNHSDARAIFVENQTQLDKILEVRNKLPKLQHIIILDGEPAGAEDVLTWNKFLALADQVSDEDFKARTQAVKPDDLAALVYTSGTTGTPKGAMITHKNLLFTSWSATESLELKPHYETLLFLPLAHVFARLIVYFCMRRGLTINFAESMEKIAANLQEIRPHFFASVPRIFEKVYEKITTGANDAGGAKLKIFNWALATGAQVSQRKQAQQPVTGLLAVKNNVANKLVFSKIQAALGGRTVYAISGAAPLNVMIAEFFHSCGVLILEGIGMTENTSFTNCNRIDNYKFGTVGQPGPKIEQKIAEDGEVLFRGENVMRGYYKNDEATASTIDKDGWLYTGDIGEIDNDGFLKITDRKKDLIITAGGKNVAPQRVERALRTSRYVSQVVAFGDRKKYLTALVTLNPEEVLPWAEKAGLPTDNWTALCEHPDVKALVDAEIQRSNTDLASFESIKKCIIIPDDFTIESGEMTASMKIKRKVVIDKYKSLLEQLYQG